MNNCNLTPTLLISKIDGIAVIQTGPSELSATNNHVHSHKVGISFLGNGENNTVDLGKGLMTYSVTFEVHNKDDVKAIINICSNKRFCSVTDKWKGRIRAYVVSYKVIDNDEHLNVSVFKLELARQDGISLPFLNLFGVLSNFIQTLLNIDVSPLQLIFSSSRSMISQTSGEYVYENVFIDKFYSEMTDIINVASSQTDIYQSETLKQDVRDAIRTISSNPSFMTNAIHNIVTSAKDSSKLDKPKIFHGKAEKLIQTTYSQIEAIESDKYNAVANIINRVSAAVMIYQALNSKFTAQPDFEQHINSTVDFIMETSMTVDVQQEIIETIKQYTSSKQYNKIKTIYGKNRPMIRIVYEEYGNIDFLEAICNMNNFEDNDMIEGEVKVYDIAD